MKNPITLMVPVEAKPETCDEVKRRLCELAELTHKEPGNLNYIVHRDPEQPTSFVIYENWRDQEALDFHMAQDYLQAFLADSKALLAEEIHGTVLEIIAGNLRLA